MITVENIPDEFRTDHLLLLIGANPLPNYVAARLLAKPKSTIHLLHTTATKDVAKALRGIIETNCAAVTVEFWQIDTIDSELIRQEVKKITQTIPRTKSVGFNYTGGTKTMSVHAYRALEQAKPQAVFSYLDAQTLVLRFDGRDGEQTRSVYVGEACSVTLPDLVRLHGFSGFKTDPVQATINPVIEAILQALVEIHLTEESYEQWRNYGSTTYADFPDLALYPTLMPFTNVVEQHCGARATVDDLAAAMGRFAKLPSYSKWFNGEWLEEYVLRQIAALPTTSSINSYGMSLGPIRGERKTSSALFDLDVAAMRGYQLFAFSCMIAGTKGKKAKNNYKEHLIEAYVRAKQLGGAEARVALVCHFDDHNVLQAELNESLISEGSIRVFGKTHLLALGNHLREWIETAHL